MAGEGGGHTKARELDQTPTWAVAAVCAVIIIISILLEKVLHMVGEVSIISIFFSFLIVFYRIIHCIFFICYWIYS